MPGTSNKIRSDTPLRNDRAQKKLTLYLKNLQSKKALETSMNAAVGRLPEKNKPNIAAAPAAVVESPPSDSAAACAISNKAAAGGSPKNGSCGTTRAAKISDYVIGPQIGQGAYAIVKQGTHKLSGRKVAIKIYEKYKLIDPQRKQSVNREIQLLKKLSHPHIVKLHETIDTTKQLYLVMELVRGKSLYSYVHSKPLRRLDEAEAIVVFQQVLEGIEHCHRNLVSHRDIKSENILITPEGTVKLIDFGFSVCSAATQKLKIFCGTPSYMAPVIVNRRE